MECQVCANVLVTLKSIARGEHDKFLELLKREREAANVSQGQLARRLGLTQGYISKVEAGTLRLDVVQFLDYAHAIGFDPGDFISRLDREIQDT